MLRYSQCKIDYRRDSIEELRKKIAEILRIQESEIQQIKILKKSIDARKKPQIYYSYSVAFECGQEQKVLQKNRKDKNLSVYVPQPSLEDMVPKLNKETRERVVIVGTGPAGLLCGYYLALCGRKPLLIERGAPMWERVGKVSAFWKDGILDPDTNVSFGEGGAGTFSDGKLNTGVKDKTGKKKFILDTFIRHGAPEEIGYLSKPHIGTDELRGVIQSMGETIRQSGGTYRFHTRLTGFRYVEEESGPGQKQLRAVVVENERGEMEEIPCDKCVLAIGHSARDTFSMLYEDGTAMEQKPFAVGVRVEHPQRSINKVQYGVEDPRLPAADYKLTGKTSDGRGVYSFCMCPGGYVVNASTEPGGTVVNGMSDHARDSAHANSAIVVTVDKGDFGSDDVLSGVAFQRRLEEKTWQTGRGMIPVQRYGDFIKGVATTELNHGSPVTKGKFVLADVKKILPSYISNGIMEGMKQFGQKITDFDAEETLVLGTETRTSSPVRILRNHEFESENRRGIYPCGEGAGYAGGIMSAAMDGLRVALQIVSERNNQQL